MYTASIIGTGRIGFYLGFDKKREQPGSHTMALLENKNIRIVAGCDTCEENLSEWKSYVEKKQKSSKGKIQTFSSSKELFSNVKSDIVVVAVNEDAHLNECIAAIESKPRLVILEKPVALSIEEGEKIENASKECGVPVLVNHERRFALDYCLAKKMVEEGEIGNLQTVNGHLFSGMRVYSSDKECNGAYSLLHDGTHLVDIVSFFLEDESPLTQSQVLKNPVLTGFHWTEDVLQDGGVASKDFGVSEHTSCKTIRSLRNITAHFETKKCSDVNVYVSGRSRYFEFNVELIGTEGKIVVGNGIFTFEKRTESKLYTGFYSLEKKKFSRPKKTLYFSNMIQNAVDFLDGKSEIKSPLNVAMNDLRTLMEIKEKLQ